MGGWAVAVAAALLAGCDSTGLPFCRSESSPPPPERACQIVAAWHNCVAYAADPTHNGTQSPGIAGRFYIFGEEIDYPRTADGSLTVDLYDESKGASTMLERWEIDPRTLQRLVKKDMIGWGYTLFLPWSRFSADITRVRMKVRYQPAKGAPLFTENAVTLAPSNGQVSNTTRSEPVAGK
jgi:hypothetical protein